MLLAICTVPQLRVQDQLTHTKFAGIAIHRKTDWKIAKKLLNSDATAVRGVKLIEIIAAIKIQAMVKGYLCRKHLRRNLTAGGDQ